MPSLLPCSDESDTALALSPPELSAVVWLESAALLDVGEGARLELMPLDKADALEVDDILVSDELLKADELLTADDLDEA